jgi:type I restriction enzyme S subunit
MNQNMWRINPLDSENLSPEFLFHFLHRCNRALGVGLTQSTHGHLTQTAYKAQKIPLPPLPEQRRIVAELDALQTEVDALKRLQAETAIKLDALLPSILDKAFKGEL